MTDCEDLCNMTCYGLRISSKEQWVGVFFSAGEKDWVQL